MKLVMSWRKVYLKFKDKICKKNLAMFLKRHALCSNQETHVLQHGSTGYKVNSDYLFKAIETKVPFSGGFAYLLG